MRVTQTSVETRVFRTYELENAPTVTKRYSKTVYRPTRVIAEFRGNEFERLYVTGYRMLKNGNPSDYKTSEEYSLWAKSDIPAWLRPFTIWITGPEIVEGAES